MFRVRPRALSRPRVQAPILSFVSDSARVRQRIRVTRIPIRYLAEGREAIGHLKNVSRSGLFIRAPELPRPGAVVALQFRSPTGTLVDVRGEVRWTTAVLDAPDVRPGFGVLLHEPARQFIDFFRWVIGQLDPEKGDETQIL